MDDERVSITLLSDTGRYEEISFAEGAKVLRSEDLMEETGSCQPGDPKGDVSFEETSQPKPGKVGVTGTIDLGDGSLTFGGVADKETHNGKPSFKGRLAITGGTGAYKGYKGQVDVDNCNPKRWRIDAGP